MARKTAVGESVKFGKKPERRRKIALVGTSDSYTEAPYGDPSWDIWTWNRAGLDMERWDRLFEIHRDWHYEGKGEETYLSRLRLIRSPQKVISTVRLFDDPANVVLDRDELFKRWGTIWLSSSITWAFACALDEKPTDIGLWGIDMESFEEHIVQFAGVRHFMEIAKERGVKITVASRSNLLRNPMPYPDRFETTLAMTLEAKAKMLEERIKRCEESVRSAIWIEGYHTNSGNLRIERTEDARQFIDEGNWKVRTRSAERVLNLLKGQLWATQVYRRLFIWNAELPQIGDTTDFDLEEVGPI